MGFLEKVKNMFTEEVEDEDDVKVEKIKNDVTKVTIDSPRISEEDDLGLSYNVSDEEDNFKKSKPIFFDEDDFNDLEFSKKKEEKKEKEAKVEIKEEVKEEVKVEPTVVEKKVFKPTPIISPVYGILDKNYHKEDIVSKSDIKNDDYIVEPSVDTIRNKAYGTLEDELENTLFNSSSPLFKQEDVSTDEVMEKIDENRLSSLTDDISKELDELLIEKEKFLSTKEKKEKEAKHAKTEKEESKAKHVKKTKEEKEEVKEENNDDDILDFIDSTLYKEGED